MADVQHEATSEADVHPLNRWVWANEAARLATVVTADDVHKLGYQTDTGAYWYLAATGPVVWKSCEDATSLQGIVLDPTTVGAPVEGDFLFFDGTQFVSGKNVTTSNIADADDILGLSLQNLTDPAGNQQCSPVLAFIGRYSVASVMGFGMQLRGDGPVLFGSGDPSRELVFSYTEDFITIEQLFSLGTNGVVQALTIHGAARTELRFDDNGSIIGTPTGFTWNVSSHFEFSMNATTAVQIIDDGGVAVIEGLDTYGTGAEVEWLLRGSTPTGARAGMGVGVVAGGGGSGDQDGGDAYVQAGAASGTGADGTASLRGSGGSLRVLVTADEDVQLTAGTGRDVLFATGITTRATIDAGGLTMAASHNLDFAGEIDIQRAGTTYLRSAAGLLELTQDLLQFSDAASAPEITIEETAAASANGLLLLVHGQDCTGVTSIGGDFDARPGAGTSSGGQGHLRTGAGTIRMTWDDTGIGFFAATTVAQPADQVAFTDNIGGGVNRTLAAIPDPADAPGTADDLRDDLVANVIPKIRDAISSVADGFNDLRANVLRPLGLMA
jgi:hypothetical protein